MVVDRIKTKQYYETISMESLCNCDYCKLYYAKSRQAFPELSKWLSDYGIDIEKPFEAISIDPDENGIVNYIGVQYIVFGSCPENYERTIGNITLRVAPSYPDPGIQDDFFVIEAYPMNLKIEYETTTSSNLLTNIGFHKGEIA